MTFMPIEPLVSAESAALSPRFTDPAYERVERMMLQAIEARGGEPGPSIAAFARVLLSRNDCSAVWALFGEFRQRVLADLFLRMDRQRRGIALGGPPELDDDEEAKPAAEQRPKIKTIEIINPPLPPMPSLTDNDPFFVKPKQHSEPVQAGYAAEPGTGPAKQTCWTCTHKHAIESSKTYYRCELRRANWLPGRRSDILVKSPACAKWEAAQ